MSEAYNHQLSEHMGHRPVVGCTMKVGSMFARTFQAQDWWRTSPITEILEDTPNRVVFKTRNSTYEWRAKP